MYKWGTFLALVVASSISSADYTSRAYGPRGRVMVKRPIVTWQVRANRSPQIERTETRLNGMIVASRYDRETGAVVCDPGNILPAGSYNVEVKAITSQGGELTKKWSFDIASNAYASLPDVLGIQDNLFNAVNRFRRSIGMPDAVPQPRLMAAAQNHAAYLEENGQSGHIQQQGMPYFFGSTPMDRAHAFGYVDGIWEVVHSGRATLDEAVENLVSAPYHRLPFLQPGGVPVGAGQTSGRSVVMFGMIEGANGVIAHPIDGQTNVPCVWTLRERPDPLRIHDKLSRPTGYPIVLAAFVEGDEKMSLKSASVTDENGEEVSLAINTPQNDEHLSQAIILLPRKPLEPGMRYTVKVDAALDGRGAIRRTWKFSTEPSGQSKPRQKR